MNTQVRQQVIETIESLETFDIFKTLSTHRPASELDSLIVGDDLSLKSLISKFQRALKQLKSELLSDNYFYLPFENNDPRLSGSFNLINNLNNLRSQIESNNPDGFYNSLMNQITYQIIWGFWDRSNRKVHDIDAIQLNEAIENIDLTRKVLSAQSVKLDELYQSIFAKTNDMQSFIEQKQRDVELISSKRDEILNHVSQANQIIIDANELRGQTEAARNSAVELRDESKRLIDEQGESVRNFHKNGAELILKIDSMFKNSQEKLKEIKEDYDEVSDMKEFIKSKEEEIIKLTGHASDGALGHMFNKRKLDLEKTANRWMWATIGMTIVLFAWIFVVFYCLNGTLYKPEWINPLVAVLKTVPAFILLAFFARQYTKERNLQEEYAFKASIAMTIMAYADVIDTDNENSHRIEIIKQSIDTVYKVPRITTEKMGIGFSLRSRKEASESLNNAIKAILEAAQSLKK